MRILEISRSGLFKALHPEGTDWFRWGSPLTAQEPLLPGTITPFLLTRSLRALIRRTYDLVVLPAIHPDHGFDQPKGKQLVKNGLQLAGKLSGIGALLDRLVGTTPNIIVDIRDESVLCETTRRLFPRHVRYFKRELDEHQTDRDPRIRPLPLFLPDSTQIPMSRRKSIDVFFAGTVCNRVRADALAAARTLASRGFRVHIPDTPLAYASYMSVMADSWLVLSPEGFGWDCYRHYEACLANSVPVINRPRASRSLYLEDGRHCLYYDAEEPDLPSVLIQALADREKLTRMAQSGRCHVLANHTREAVAQYMLRDSLPSPRPPEVG
jgi:hypothetical protein